jgi:hypothetical protein
VFPLAKSQEYINDVPVGELLCELLPEKVTLRGAVHANAGDGFVVITGFGNGEVEIKSSKTKEATQPFASVVVSVTSNSPDKEKL